MKFRLTAVFPFIVFTISMQADAQSPQEDSLLCQTAISNTISIYKNQLGDQSPLYNGSRYSTTGFIFRTGSPYFLSDSFSRGSVVYDGILFDSLNLLYEDLRELLIVKNDNYLLQLVNQKISSFTISDHSFIRLTADSSSSGIPKTGFYEVLYNGHSQVLKKTYKTIIEEPSVYENTVIRHIDVGYNYYIKIGNGYKRVKSDGELIDLLTGHRKEIQKFIKKNKLKFRRDKENVLIRVAWYYDQISK
jgi:hypothetical protein